MTLIAAVTNVRGLVVALLIVLLIAAFVYAVCTYLAHRPDVGRTAAAVIAVVGAIFVLLDYL